MASAHFVVSAEFSNRRAVKALASAIRCVQDAAEDMPWNTELKQAAKRLRYAAKHIKASAKRAE